MNVIIHIYFFFFFFNIRLLPIAFNSSSSSMALQPFVGPWPPIQFGTLFYTVGRTPWRENQAVTRPLPAHRTAQTE
jgi:hypothetical protein